MRGISDQDKIKREPQLFLPVRPDTLFAPYDIHKQGLQTNRCSVSHSKNYTFLYLIMYFLNKRTIEVYICRTNDTLLQSIN